MDEIEQGLGALAAEGRSQLQREGVAAARIEPIPSVDLRYQGQAHTLNVPWQDLQAVRETFHRLHEHRYGHRLDVGIELVNLRVGLRGRVAPVCLPRWACGQVARPLGTTAVYGVDQPAVLWQRRQLSANQWIESPAIIVEEVATTYVAPGWRCRVDEYGNLVLNMAS